MNRYLSLLVPLTLVAACSETNLDDLDAEEIAETEKQVEAEAKSLEEAADEAVKILESEIQAELDDEIDIVQSELAEPEPTDDIAE